MRVSNDELDTRLTEWEQSLAHSKDPADRAMIWLVGQFRTQTGKGQFNLVRTTLERIAVPSTLSDLTEESLDEFRARERVGLAIQVMQQTLRLAEEEGKAINLSAAKLILQKVVLTARRWRRDLPER